MAKTQQGIIFLVIVVLNLSLIQLFQTSTSNNLHAVNAATTLCSNCTSMDEYITSLNNEIDSLKSMEYKLIQAISIINATTPMNDSVASILSNRVKQLKKIQSAKDMIQMENDSLIGYLSGIVNNTKGKLYGDGHVAESCQEYRHPSNTYYKYNNEGSGYYQIKPASIGQVITAYCDMESDGGGWTVVGNWIDSTSQVIGYNNSLSTNFWGLNQVPTHNQSMVYTFNSLKKYAWIYDAKISYSSTTDQSIRKISKALYNATGVNSCTVGSGYDYFMLFYANKGIILGFCEAIFTVPLSQNCNDGNTMIHMSNKEYGTLPNNGANYTPPSCSYRCGPTITTNQQFRILVR